MSEPIISVRNISKHYRLGQIGMSSLRSDVLQMWRKLNGKSDPASEALDFWALRNVTFDVSQGQVMGIVGKNGAGKSTLLKILSRITEPSSGEAFMRGRVASLLEVGTGFHPDLTGRENVFLNGTMLGMSRTEVARKLDEIIEFAEIAKFIDTPVKRYSSGMYVRLAFAVAAHLEPEILIVDEVLAVGDASFQRRCLGKMKDVATGGRTVLFVSHNMAAVGSLCTEAVWMAGGTVRSTGSAQKVISEYISEEGGHRNEIDFTRSQGAPTKDVHFLRARICNQEGETCGVFKIGDSMAIEFEIQVNRKVGLLSIAVELTAGDGLQLANMVDRDSSFEIEAAPGVHRFRVELKDMRFYPDSYSIGLFVGGMNGKIHFDHRPLCISFEMAEGGELAPRKLPRSAGRLFLTPGWTHSILSHSA